jgi:serine/threonine-protein kinase
MTLDIPNIIPEKPQRTGIENTTNNVTTTNMKTDVLNRSTENPAVIGQTTINITEPTQSTTNVPASTRFLNFSNPIFGIKIQYPDSWSPRVYPYNNQGNNTIVGFYSPSKTASQLGNISGVSGQFVPYLDIFVFDSKNMSLDKIMEGRMKRIQNTTDVVIESKPFTLGGNHEARKLVYSTITGGDEFFKKMQIYTIYNNKVYLITFTAQETLFSNYIPLIEKMINTFEISGTGF